MVLPSESLRFRCFAACLGLAVLLSSLILPGTVLRGQTALPGNSDSKSQSETANGETTGGQADSPQADRDQFSASDELIRRGKKIDLALPIRSEEADRLTDSLVQMASNSGSGGTRSSVVLRLHRSLDSSKPSNSSANDDPSSEKSAAIQPMTEFETALKIARVMNDDSTRKLRIVVWVDTQLNDHASLLMLAADEVILSSTATVAPISDPDPLFAPSYEAIAQRQGLIPKEVATAIATPGYPLAWVTTIDGESKFLGGNQWKQAAEEGKINRESVWADPTTPFRVGAEKFRSAQLVTAVVNSEREALDALNLTEWEQMDADSLGEAKAIRFELIGTLSPRRIKRLRSNLQGVDNQINTYFFVLDSPGGAPDSSADLASTLIDPTPPITRSVGVVEGVAHGDAVLPVLACKPLYMTEEATLGGAGAADLSEKDVAVQRELVDLIAKRTGRSAGLILGLLNRDSKVYRYTNIRTGAVAYGKIDDITFGEADPDAAAARWEKGIAIDLSKGLSAGQALEYGLIDGVVSDSTEAARLAGFETLPTPLKNRTLVRMIERFGASPFLSFLLIMIGLSALSAEANAPGLGIPGFIALICFGLFFWTKFLSGTAEWFELVILALGLICIGIEIFVVPGVGVFGIGGVIMTVTGIVLMSQSFVVPKNGYQLAVLSRGVWSALGALIAMIIAFVAFRIMLPHVPLLRGLVMEGVDEAALDQSERLADYSNLVGQSGIATTPIRPSGKAKIGDEILHVISEGAMIEKDASIRVAEVHGTRIVVVSE